MIQPPCRAPIQLIALSLQLASLVLQNPGSHPHALRLALHLSNSVLQLLDSALEAVVLFIGRLHVLSAVGELLAEALDLLGEARGQRQCNDNRRFHRVYSTWALIAASITTRIKAK